MLNSEDWINCNPLILQFPEQPICHIPGQLRFYADTSLNRDLRAAVLR